MKKIFKKLVTLGLALSLSILSITTAFASEWKQDVIGWKVQNENGSYLTNSWYQSPTSGLWYYIGGDGYMLTNATTPDGHAVDINGVWFSENTGKYGDYGKPMYDRLVHDWVNWVAEDEEILRLEAKGFLVNISDENFEAVIKEILAMERAPRGTAPQPTQPVVNNDGFTQEELDEYDRITESLGGAPDVEVMQGIGMSDNGGAYNWGN